jgi:hypothetical protein
MSELQRFIAPLEPTERGRGGHVLRVPEEVVDALGGCGRTPVNATFNGIPYRGSIVRMGGFYCIGVLTSIVEESDLEFGDPVEVTVERDTAERTVEAPGELVEAFGSDPSLLTAWDALSFTARKGMAREIEGAKRPETRARRVETALGTLRQRSRGG